MRAVDPHGGAPSDPGGPPGGSLIGSGGSDDAGGDALPDAASGSVGDAATPGADAAPGMGRHVSGAFTSTAGQRDWTAYIPSSYQPGTPMPLVTVLHGCSQSVAQIEATTDYTTLAEKRGFIVVYPVQSITANTLQCWNWFELINQARDAGEPALIAGATRMVMQSFSVDPKRVYVIGASAGGAMAVIMGATYPDLYAAVGVVVGCEFGGYPCSVAGGPDPVAQGARAYQAMGSYARRQPVIVFHGDTDTVVPPINAQQLVRQWLTTNDWADDGKHNGSVPSSPSTTSTGQVPNGRSYEIDLYGAAGQVLLEHVIINGAGHAWPGGPASATFTDPSGPDATTLSYDFFLAHPAP